MTIISLLLMVMALVFSPESMGAPYSGRSQTASYDELLLVLQWPISYCNTGEIICNYPIPLEFTVHGLWLNENSKSVICQTPKYRINLQQRLSSDLRKELEKYWPNLNSQRHPEFLWEHEYTKHGHCITEFHNHVDYFKTALAIATDIGDVMTMRLSSGETLGETLKSRRLYHAQDFKHVTIASRKLTPLLRCNHARDGEIPQLHEIVFCTDKNKILKSCLPKVKDCNKRWKGCDGGYRWGFKIPSVEESQLSCPALPSSEM